MTVGSPGNNAEEAPAAMYVDEHGFMLTSAEPSPALTQKQMDEENKKTDHWIKLLASWDANKTNYAKQKKLARRGIAPALRGLAWQLILGSRMLQHENPDEYNSFLEREINQADLDVVKRDLPRTFPTHGLFASYNSIGQTSLFNVLRAYAAYDPRMGYCQGMGFIVATLLTQMGEEEAFWAFVVMMKDSRYQMNNLYLAGFPKVQESFGVLRLLIEKFAPRLAEHFEQQGVSVSFFASQWFMTLFVYIFPFKLLLRVWDIFLVEGWKIIFRVAVALLVSEQEELCSLMYVK
eukprot:gene14014-21428_t